MQPCGNHFDIWTSDAARKNAASLSDFQKAAVASAEQKADAGGLADAAVRLLGRPLDALGQAYVDEQMAKYNAVVHRHGEALSSDPSLAINVMCRQHKTFTREQTAGFLRCNTVDAPQLEACMFQVMTLVVAEADMMP